MGEDYRIYQMEAEEIAREAGRLLLDSQGRVSIREKGPADLVTEADFASQKLIADRIARLFPAHTLLGEEEGLETDFDAPWRWVVDPLDGTMNFAHGFPFWCVSIALEHLGQLVVGVIYHPLTNELYSSSFQQGATLNGRSIKVSGVQTLSEALITTGLPTNFAADADRQMAYMKRFSTETHSLRRTGSSALNLAILATGGCDVCYATSMLPWDAAAGVVLVREAGGDVTRLGGQPYNLYDREILATNGRIHEESVQALEATWPSL